jgi:4-amino-4-deoxy-L-arabinose transferase-like glycosyltransferase
MEMLYTLGLFLNGAALAKLNHLLALVLTLALLFGLGRRLWGRMAGTVALACYVSAPIVLLEAGTAYIDLGYALYYLLAASAFVIWWVEGKRAWLIASGIFCGLCLGTKMTGAIGFGSLAALLIYRVAKERRGWQDLGAFVLPSVLVAAPWYLKSQIWTGNPTYPFFYGLFGGRNWDAAMATAYRIEQEKFGLGSGILQLLLLPINLAFRHEHFMDVGYARPLSSPGVLWLCLLPSLLLLRKHDRALKVILAAELRRLGVTHALVPDDWLASRDSELERLKVPEFRQALRQAIQLGLLQKRFDDGFTTVLQVEGEGEGG